MGLSRHVQLLKFLDKTFGKMLVRIIPVPDHFIAKCIPRNILLIRPGGIGDAVLLQPLISVIKNRYPDAAIDILAEKRNCSVFTICPHVRSVYLYDRPKHLITALRNCYDIVIDTEQWHRLSTVIARFNSPRIIIGFDTNERKRLLTYAIPYSHQDYEVQSFLNLLNPLGYVPPQETEYPFIHTPATLVNKVAKILRPLSGKNLIALFPGASIIEKRWEDDNFVALADRLSQKGFAVVVLGMANEKQIGEKMIAGRCGLSLAGKTSLLETAAVILQSKMLISGDTGVLHIAAGLGVPTVSLFGPSNIEKWAPKGEQHVVLSRHLPCSPCSEFGYTPKCPVNGRCMSEITVDDVVTAVEKLLGRRRKISDFLG